MLFAVWSKYTLEGRITLSYNQVLYSMIFQNRRSSLEIQYAPPQIPSIIRPKLSTQRWLFVDYVIPPM